MEKVVTIEAAAVENSSACATAASMSTLTSPNNKKSKRQGSGRWKKRSSAASFEGELLHQMMTPENGRMFMNGASKIACLYTQQGKKGTNQDAMIVLEVSAVLPFVFLSSTSLCV